VPRLLLAEAKVQEVLRVVQMVKLVLLVSEETVMELEGVVIMVVAGAVAVVLATGVEAAVGRHTPLAQF